MDINTYQNWTKETAIYPKANTKTVDELMYLSLGLAGEAGEVANKIKKLYRDGDNEKLRQETTKELGDIMWYMGRLAETLDIKLADLMQANHDKLVSRKQRGVIGGSGDNR